MSILHADNPTTSLGHPHSYSGSFLRPSANNGISNLTQPFDNGDFGSEDRWLLDNDLILAESSYVDKLLGLNNQVDDDITRVLNNDSSPLSDPNLFFNGKSHHQLRHLCKQVLTQKIPQTGIRYWDATIFAVNFLFLLFLLAKLACVWRRRVNKSLSSTMFKEFFALVFIITLLNMGHAIGSSTLSATNQIGSLIDQLLWFGLKFALFTTEICILFFGLCVGQSSTARGVCCGLFIAVLFALLHSAFQSIFDFRLWDEYINFDFLRVPGYEEILNFWVLSSAFIGLLYLMIGFISMVCCRREPCILRRCSFFTYCLLMSLLNFSQSLAALLIRLDCPDGLCVADLVTLSYFTLFAPIVYFLFLRGLTRSKRAGGGLFSYRTHKNDPSSEANGYYPRFSGLISPSYDDLFDYDRIMQQQDNTHMENILHLSYDFYHAANSSNPSDPHQIPLMMTRTPDSTLTTHIDSDPSGGYGTHADLNEMSSASESRPIIRAPYASGNTTFGQGVGKTSGGGAFKPKNLQVRSDGQLTFSTVSTSS